MMNHIAIILCGLLIALGYSGESAVIVTSIGLAPLYQYEHKYIPHTHYYNTNVTIINACIPGKTGYQLYVSEGIACILEASKTDKTISLHHYKHAAGPRSFFLYTTNKTEVGDNNSTYVHTGIVGYCHPSQRENTVPLYRYMKPIQVQGTFLGYDHYYTTDANEIDTPLNPGDTGHNGYQYVGITCFVHKFEKVTVKEES